MAMSSCPRCAGALEAIPGDEAGSRCTGCGGFWITEQALRNGIRAFLHELGITDMIVAFHESPAGTTDSPCPSCRDARLGAVRFRGVIVERCNECGGIFLDEGETEQISQRVLFSATTPKESSREGSKRLSEFLANPLRIRGSYT